MPRPKVHPSQRKRAAEACNFCRMSKKKCSATVPCTACQRRGIGHTCYLTNTSRSPGSVSRAEQSNGARPSRTTSARRPGCRNESAWPLDAHPSTWLPSTPAAPLQQDGYQPISPSDSRTAATDTNGAETGLSPPENMAQSEAPALGPESHARMLLNLRGERGNHRQPSDAVAIKLTLCSLHRGSSPDIVSPVCSRYCRVADWTIAIFA